jgi:nicotinamidase-related amidase
MLHSRDVPITQSALLVIDAQDSFKVTPRWERRSNPQFERNTGALIDAYRKAELPVIFFLHTDGDPHFQTASPHFKLMDFIERRASEPLLVKDTRNCFTSTNLGSLLLRLGARRLIVTGIQTEQCCETTARVGADLGYAVDFVTEATMTFPIASDVPGRELPVEAVCERTEYALARRFARIATVAELEAELANS